MLVAHKRVGREHYTLVLLAESGIRYTASAAAMPQTVICMRTSTPTGTGPAGGDRITVTGEGVQFTHTPAAGDDADTAVDVLVGPPPGDMVAVAQMLAQRPVTLMFCTAAQAHHQRAQETLRAEARTYERAVTAWLGAERAWRLLPAQVLAADVCANRVRRARGEVARRSAIYDTCRHRAAMGQQRLAQAQASGVDVAYRTRLYRQYAQDAEAGARRLAQAREALDRAVWVAAHQQVPVPFAHQPV